LNPVDLRSRSPSPRPPVIPPPPQSPVENGERKVRLPWDPEYQRLGARVQAALDEVNVQQNVVAGLLARMEQMRAVWDAQVAAFENHIAQEYDELDVPNEDPRYDSNC